MFEMSNSEFVSAICRRNTVEDPTISKYTPLISRENPQLFHCACDDVHVVVGMCASVCWCVFLCVLVRSSVMLCAAVRFSVCTCGRVCFCVSHCLTVCFCESSCALECFCVFVCLYACSCVSVVCLFVLVGVSASRLLVLCVHVQVRLSQRDHV